MLLERARRIARRRGTPPAPADFDLLVLLGQPDGSHLEAGECARLHAMWDAPRRLLVAELMGESLALVEASIRQSFTTLHGWSAWTVAAKAAGSRSWWTAAKPILLPAAPEARPLALENAVDAWRELSLVEWQAKGRGLRDTDVARLLNGLAGQAFDAAGGRAAR